MSVQGVDKRKISVHYYFITVAWALIQVMQYFVFFQLSHETLHTPQLYTLTSFSSPFLSCGITCMNCYGSKTRNRNNNKFMESRKWTKHKTSLMCLFVTEVKYGSKEMEILNILYVVNLVLLLMCSCQFWLWQSISLCLNALMNVSGFCTP